MQEFRAHDGYIQRDGDQDSERVYGADVEITCDEAL